MEYVEHYEYDNVVMKDKTRLSISNANRKKVRKDYYKRRRKDYEYPFDHLSENPLLDVRFKK